jgi:hypothetical protein
VVITERSIFCFEISFSFGGEFKGGRGLVKDQVSGNLMGWPWGLWGLELDFWRRFDLIKDPGQVNSFLNGNDGLGVFGGR